MILSKTNIKFQKFKADVPVIKFKLSTGVEFNAVIDTGSESTVIDEKFVKNNQKSFHKTSESDMSLIGMSGNSIHRVHCVSSMFFIDGKKCMVSGITSDLSSLNSSVELSHGEKMCISVILGCDMLKQLGAIIDFDKQSLKVKL